MAQLTIEIPDRVVEYLELQVATGQSSSVSDEVARILSIHCEREAIEQKLLAAELANDTTEVTPDFWTSLRNRIPSN